MAARERGTALEELAGRVARRELKLADALRLVRQQAGAPAAPPRPRSERGAVRAGQPLRLSLSAPLHGEAVLVAQTRRGRLKLDYRPLDDLHIETSIPGEALESNGETVRLWLSQAGIAAGPAIVRVLPGPVVRRAEWAQQGSSGVYLELRGEGFGSDPSTVYVTVGDQVWQPTEVSDDRVALALPDRPGRSVWVSVEAGGRSSDPVLARAGHRAALESA